MKNSRGFIGASQSQQLIHREHIEKISVSETELSSPYSGDSSGLKFPFLRSFALFAVVNCRFLGLVFGIWNFSGAWGLVLGVSLSAGAQAGLVSFCCVEHEQRFEHTRVPCDMHLKGRSSANVAPTFLRSSEVLASAPLAIWVHAPLP